MRICIDVILFSVTFTCIAAITFNLLAVELNGSLNLEIIVSFGNLIRVGGITFLYFYLADWLTTDLLDIGDIFYESVWYQLPAQQQKLLGLPIQRAQRVMRLTGLGLFECSLPVFAGVIFTASLELDENMTILMQFVCVVTDNSHRCLVLSDYSKL